MGKLVVGLENFALLTYCTRCVAATELCRCIVLTKFKGVNCADCEAVCERTGNDVKGRGRERT